MYVPDKRKRSKPWPQESLAGEGQWPRLPSAMELSQKPIDPLHFARSLPPEDGANRPVPDQENKSKTRYYFNTRHIMILQE